MDDDAVPDQPDLAVLALELTVLHVAACHGTDAGDLVGLAHLGMAQQHLTELGRQHTLHSGLDLVDGIIDDTVHPHIHVGTGGGVTGGVVGADVKAHDDGLRRRGQHHIGLVDGAHTAVDDTDTHLVVAELLQGCLHRLHAALNIGLDDQVQVLHLTGLDLAEQILQRDLGDRGVGLGLLLGLALLHQLTGQLLIGHGIEGSPGSRSLAETGDLHRHRGPGGGDLLALVADHGPDTAHGGTGDDDIALLQRAVLHQQRGHGATALVQTGLDDRTLSGTVGVGLQLTHLGGQRQHLQQIVHAHTGLGGNGADNGVAAPLLTHQPVLGELLLDALGIGLRLIHLVDGHDNGDPGSLGMVDGLHRLGHDTVLGGHHQNGDIRHHGSSGPHGGKCLVAGGIQEGDGLAVDLHLIGTDVLGDTAGLAAGHMGVADIVQQTGLAVVHMTHDHHHGGTGYQILLVVLVVVDELLLDGDHYLLLHLAAHLLGDDGGGIEVNELAQGGHDAVFHQALDYLCAGLFHAAGQLAHADLIGDLHGNGGLFDDLQPQAAQTIRLLLLAFIGKTVVPALAAVAELLLALGLLLGPTAAAGAALRHVLQLLVVLIQIHRRGLAGVHHLGLRHTGDGLGLLLGRTALPLALRLLLGGLGGRLLLLLGRLGPLGEDHLNPGYLIVLGQILKDQRQLPILQDLHMVLGRFGVLGQDLRDLLGGDSEVLRHLMHSIFVSYATQIKPPPSL